MADPFIDRQDLSDYLGRDVTADSGGLIAVDAACDICRSLAEQTFNQATSTVTLDGTGTDALLLPERPVSAAGTVTVSGTAVTDYVLNGNGMLIRKVTDPTSVDWWTDQPFLPAPKWPAGRQNVVVTYDHGYASDDLPRDIRMVALAIASRLIVQGPALQEQNGQVSVRYGINATDLTNGEKAILTKYRQIC
jgi:hypothetical protein